MRKQPLNKTFIYFLQFSIFLLISATLLSCEDKKKSGYMSPKEVLTSTTSKRYSISDYKNKPYKTILNQKMLLFKKRQKSVLVIYCFDSNKHSNEAQMHTLNKLEKKFKKNVSMKYIPVDNVSNPENRQFLNTLYSNIHIKKTNHLPLIIIFKNNYYYSHFEGLTPIEMIRYDIQQALNK